MPWSETTKMRERVRFMGDLERELFSMTELCQRYRISRQTGYKWVVEHAPARSPEFPPELS